MNHFRIIISHLAMLVGIFIVSCVTVIGSVPLGSGKYIAALAKPFHAILGPLLNYDIHDDMLLTVELAIELFVPAAIVTSVLYLCFYMFRYVYKR